MTLVKPLPLHASIPPRGCYLPASPGSGEILKADSLAGVNTHSSASFHRATSCGIRLFRFGGAWTKGADITDMDRFTTWTGLLNFPLLNPIPLAYAGYRIPFPSCCKATLLLLQGSQSPPEGLTSSEAATGQPQREHPMPLAGCAPKSTKGACPAALCGASTGGIAAAWPHESKATESTSTEQEQQTEQVSNTKACTCPCQCTALPVCPTSSPAPGSTLSRGYSIIQSQQAAPCLRSAHGIGKPSRGSALTRSNIFSLLLGSCTQPFPKSLASTLGDRKAIYFQGAPVDFVSHLHLLVCLGPELCPS